MQRQQILVARRRTLGTTTETHSSKTGRAASSTSTLILLGLLSIRMGELATDNPWQTVYCCGLHVDGLRWWLRLVSSLSILWPTIPWLTLIRLLGLLGVVASLPLWRAWFFLSVDIAADKGSSRTLWWIISLLRLTSAIVILVRHDF